jgi:hypothetical protein
MVAHIEDWDNYITALATRYKGKMIYELWNEPSANPALSVDDMVTLITQEYNIIRKIDPGATIVCCAFTQYKSFSYMRKFFAAGGLKNGGYLQFPWGFWNAGTTAGVDQLANRYREEHPCSERP